MTSDEYPYWTHEELAKLDYDISQREYWAAYSYVMSFDSDSVSYPPVEYWEDDFVYNE